MKNKRELAEFLMKERVDFSSKHDCQYMKADLVNSLVKFEEMKEHEDAVSEVSD